MADRKNHDTEIDEEKVRALADLLDEKNLTEIEYVTEDWSVRVARGGTVSAAIPTAAAAPASAPAAPAAAPAPEAAAAGGLPAGTVTSPMVGTVYLAPEPDAANFVGVGDQVSEGQTLLLIEAMKTYNEIRAPRSGEIKEILVENGTPVEFGDALLVIG